MSLILLSDGSSTIELPGSLDWTDRNAWSPVAQAMTRGLTGKPIVQIAELNAGRPITLEGNEKRAWVPRAVADAVQAWADVGGKPMSLTLYGTTYPVMFRHHEVPAFTARPLLDRANPPADWPHYLVLKFMTRTA